MAMTLDGSNGVTFNDSSLQGAAASPFGLKNRIINGDMRIAQRGTSFSFGSAGGDYRYAADRFATQDYTWSAGSNITISNDTTVYPTGFSNSYKYATGATGLTLAAGGVQFIRHVIEGYNIADCYTGNITLSFWVRASTTGQYNITLTNNSILLEKYTTKNYTINAANTWEQKTITVDLSAGIASGGTWNTTNGEGLNLYFMVGAHANRTGNDGLNTWATGGSPNYSYQTTGCVNLSTIANSTFYITGVQLERGSTATPFERRLFGTELALCQRYYWQQVSAAAATGTRALGAGSYLQGGYVEWFAQFPIPMRSNPSVISTTVVGGYEIYRAGVSDSFDVVGLGSSNTNTAFLYNNTQVSGTAGQAGSVYCNSASTSVAFSAEL